MAARRQPRRPCTAAEADCLRPQRTAQLLWQPAPREHRRAELGARSSVPSRGVMPPHSCSHSSGAAHAGAREAGDGGAEAAAGLALGRGKACCAEPGAFEGCGGGMTRCSSGGGVQARRRAVARSRT